MTSRTNRGTLQAIYNDPIGRMWRVLKRTKDWLRGPSDEMAVIAVTRLGVVLTLFSTLLILVTFIPQVRIWGDDLFSIWYPRAAMILATGLLFHYTVIGYKTAWYAFLRHRMGPFVKKVHGDFDAWPSVKLPNFWTYMTTKDTGALEERTMRYLRAAREGFEQARGDLEREERMDARLSALTNQLEERGRNQPQREREEREKRQRQKIAEFEARYQQAVDERLTGTLPDGVAKRLFKQAGDAGTFAEKRTSLIAAIREQGDINVKQRVKPTRK